MARKQSPFIKYLREAWLNHLIKERPKGAALYDWFSFLFCIDERPILVTKAKSGFSVPGIYLQDGTHPLEGAVVLRSLKGGATLFIRRDLKTEFFEVETALGVFKLTISEWERIKKHVTLPNPEWPDSGAGHRDSSGNRLGGVS